jgi:hypothetical protein
MEQEIINYPLLYPCTQAGWNGLEKSANLLLGFPNEDKETYSQKMIDANGKIYFIVYHEVAELVDLTKCVTFEDVEFPKLKNT